MKHQGFYVGKYRPILIEIRVKINNAKPCTLDSIGFLGLALLYCMGIHQQIT
jgi:hypothetical protein